MLIIPTRPCFVFDMLVHSIWWELYHTVCLFIPTCLVHIIYLYSHQNSLLQKIKFVSHQKVILIVFSMIHTSSVFHTMLM